jgi:hypothetical protein
MGCFHCGRVRLKTRDTLDLAAIAAGFSAWIEFYVLRSRWCGEGRVDMRVRLSHSGLSWQ